MVVNTLGYVPVLDFGAPRIISGRAREVISGGELVSLSGATAVVGSGASSFNPTTDLLFVTDASGLAFTGVAIANAGSNENLSVAIDGVIISTCDTDATLPSLTVASKGVNSVGVATTAGHVIGRSLTSAASGTSNFIMWKING